MSKRRELQVACYVWNAALIAGSLTLGSWLIGCGDDANPPPQPMGDAGVDSGRDPDVPLPPLGEGLLSRASRSSTIAINEDDSIVVMVNPEDGSISTFTTSDDQRLARVTVGAEPSSVVIHPNGTTAFVANRADATVVRIDGIDTPAPEIIAAVAVGSEPTGLALTPTGSRLFVAEHAEGRVGVIDTATMLLTSAIEAPQNPYALTVTNDGDAEDGDELIIVPEFFGEPTAAGEATDGSRQGRVRVYQVSDLAPTDPIELVSIDSGFAPEGGSTVITSPNQLASAFVQGGKLYLTSVSASPAGPPRFNLNVQPVLYVADLETGQMDRGPAGTVNLARAAKDAAGTDPVLFLADLIDVSFIGDSGIAYVLSRGSDTIQRVVFGESDVTLGSDRNLQIDLLAPPAGADVGCQTPTGLVTSHDAPRAYVNCWVSRRLGVVDLSLQALATTVEASGPPTGAEVEVARGRRFFYTGRGRWSDNGWSSCGSCHPGGLTDNITWAFAAGPRQTTSLDGSFSHGEGPQEQRIFNWTGVFDELHDFERNTRGVSGGLGAVTTSATGSCGTLSEETRDPVDLPGNLAQPIKELQDRAENCTSDWDAIDAYVQTIRPPRGRRFLDSAAVARGAALFGMPDASSNNGGCVACHGGAGWTASRRFFTPSTDTNTDLMSSVFTPPSGWAAGWNQHTTQIAPQPAGADSTGAVQGPPQVACVIRDVDTFGVPGDDTETTRLESRANGARAQGDGGYNIPSLYGLAVGAPYLHHGQAGSLEELFSDPAWEAHLMAANPVFLTTGDRDQSRADLVQFLLSIDATTAEQPVPDGFDGCAP